MTRVGADLERLGELVREHSGIDLRDAGLRALASAIAKVAPGLDAGGVLRAVADSHAGPALVPALVEAVAVHETFFFRQRRDLDAIDWQGLLATAHAAGSERVRVWVAACSTGEEAYTLAMLASEAFGTPDPPVVFVATDVSGAALAKARAGAYRRRSVKFVDPALRARYFDRQGDRLHVGDVLRRLVDFRQQNLVCDQPPGPAFELILCRNVLIYFDAPTAQRVTGLLEAALAHGGALILGAADRLCGMTARPRSTPRRRHAVPTRREPVAPAPSWRDTPPCPAAATLEPDGDRLAIAMAAADAGHLAEAIETVEAILAESPLDADAHFVRGLAALGLGNAEAAADALRRAVYADPGFAIAAFKLGRAYDHLGDDQAATRAYAQALRMLASGQASDHRLGAGLSPDDVATACRVRLRALS